ncbi:stage II sporulation protein M [Bacillus sp. 1P06AnD]|uniref:stage II sporulation protein M n=1 Tax=Bacillus sp. 1P06AnD TaxID=3132208 RepID=UPI00399FE3DE
MIKKTYSNEWHKFTSFYRNYFIVCVVLFLAIVILTVVGTKSLDRKTVEDMMAGIMKSFEDKGMLQEQAAYITMFKIFFNNLFACILAIVFGFIPYVLPLVVLIGNGAVVGVLLGAISLNGGSIASWVLRGLVPHGITEMTAVLLSIGIGLFISTWLVKKIAGKETKTFGTVVKMVAQTFIAVILPLLVISAVIEVYITPLFLT